MKPRIRIKAITRRVSTAQVWLSCVRKQVSLQTTRLFKGTRRTAGLPGQWVASLKLGRVFRKMGLPIWTFTGVGISAIWFNYLGSLLEKLLRDLLRLNPNPASLGDYVPSLIVSLVPFLLVLVIGLWQRGHQSSKRRFVSSGLQKPEGKKGLILLVSRVESAMFSIQYHFVEQKTLERVWLLPSNTSNTGEFGTGTLAIAQEIQRQCEVLAQDQGVPLQVEIFDQGVSPGDSQDTFDLVNRVFRRSGYETSELIADFTGGTKPMSVGMIMACLPAERELEYVSLAAGRSRGPFVVDYQHRVFDLVG